MIKRSLLTYDLVILSCFTCYISEMSSFNGWNLYHYPPSVVCGGWLYTVMLANRITAIVFVFTIATRLVC